MKCIGCDPFCPCQDGMACHYRDASDGTKAFAVPPPMTAEPGELPDPDAKAPDDDYATACPECAGQGRYYGWMPVVAGLFRMDCDGCGGTGRAK